MSVEFGHPDWRPPSDMSRLIINRNEKCEKCTSGYCKPTVMCTMALYLLLDGDYNKHKWSDWLWELYKETAKSCNLVTYTLEESTPAPDSDPESDSDY